jgi:hypothetical protein
MAQAAVVGITPGDFIQASLRLNQRIEKTGEITMVAIAPH